MTAPNGVSSGVSLEVPSGRRLLVTVLLTLAAATVVLLVVVLPAEYQIDPTGMGRAMGIDRLGAASEGEQVFAASDLAVSHDKTYRSEERVVELRPREEMELKIAMDEGSTVLYSWQVDRGVLYSDFHAEPYGEPEGGSVRYLEEKGVSESHGSLNAPFSGHHGWYWVNDNDFAVKVTFKVTGFFDAVKERRAQ